MTLKVLIVDDHEAAREGLSHLLGNDRIEIHSFASSSDEALAVIHTAQLDVVLLDVRMEGVDGLAALESIRAVAPDLPVVMLSTYDNPTYVARAAALGASDYVLKSTDCQRLCNAIERAANKQPLTGDSELRRVQEMMREGVDVSTLPPELPLTGREAQVLRHMALGLSNKEIAGSLQISVETVKEHVQNVLRKVNANDRTDAAVRAVKLGLID